jgi:hypothetical protein
LSTSPTIPNIGTVTTSVKPITQLPSGGTQKFQQILQSSIWANPPIPFQNWSFVSGGNLIGSFNLDDADRPTEQAIIQRWLQEFPTLQWVETVAIDTGLAILRFAHP